MIRDLLSPLSSRYEAWLACAPMLALCWGCNENKPLLGEVSVAAERGHEGWCVESSRPRFQRLDFRGLGDEASWSLTPTDIARGGARARHELPVGLYALSVSPAADVRGDETGELVFVDAPIVSVFRSQVTTVMIRGIDGSCPMSSRQDAARPLESAARVTGG